MQFNNLIRQEIYNLWTDVSNAVKDIIIEYINKNIDSSVIVKEWLMEKGIHLKNSKDNLELYIDILIYEYTFCLLNLDSKIEDMNTAIKKIDVKFIEAILQIEEINIEMKEYIENLKNAIEKYDVNSFATIYEDIVCQSHRKNNGEFYTEDDISRLIISFSLNISKDNSEKNVIDPMCGTGMFLKNLQGLKDKDDKINLWGIEKNKFTAYVCNKILQEKKKSEEYDINIINNNLFSIDINYNNVTTVNGDLKQIPKDGFDLIIGNPAYIRYQALGYLFDEIPSYIKEYYISLGKKLSDSSDYVRFVSIYIRALLLCKDSYRNEILERINQIVKKKKILNNEDEWDTLIKSYSGLSDSIVPTWFLSYKLCKPKGVMGYITSNSWLKKEYGNHLKKFFINNTKLKYVFDMSNINCFNDAQVNTSIVVCQKDTNFNDNCIRFIKFKGDNGKRVKLRVLILSILYKNKLEIIDERYIFDIFNKFVESLETDYEDEYISIKLIYQNHLRDEYNAGSVDWGRYFQKQSILEKIINDKWETINNQQIMVNQGLRSGYNKFFYFDAVNIDKLISYNIIYEIENCDFGDKLWEQLSYNEKLKIKFRNIIFIPQDYINSNKYRLVIFKYDNMEDKKVSSIFMSKNFLRKSVKSIKNIGTYSTDNYKCNSYILYVDNKVTREDYFRLRNDYKECINEWISKGFGCVDISVEEYIKFYSKLSIINKENVIKVKDMPVLKSYENKPSNDKIPTMWYTLNFTERHLPDMFINRINYKDLNVILNSDKCVIDANFNTLTLSNIDNKEKMIYFSIFNSTIFKLQLENNCANMGGGALKIETTGIKKCKVPNINKLSIWSKNKLIVLAQKLISKQFGIDNLDIIEKIDTVIIKEMCKNEECITIQESLKKEYYNKIKERVTL